MHTHRFISHYTYTLKHTHSFIICDPPHIHKQTTHHTCYYNTIYTIHNSQSLEGCSLTAEGLAQRAQRKSVKIQDLHRGLQGALQEVATLQGALHTIMEELGTTRAECNVLRKRAAAAEVRAVDAEGMWEKRCRQLQAALAELKEAYIQGILCELGRKKGGMCMWEEHLLV